MRHKDDRIWTEKRMCGTKSKMDKMKIKYALILSMLPYFCAGCSGKMESRGWSKIAILPDGKGFLAREPFGYSNYIKCTEYYLIFQMDSGSTKPLYRLDKSGCNGHEEIDVKFNIQNDTVVLFYSDPQLRDNPSILRKMEKSKYPILFEYRENLSEVAGISEHNEILLMTSKWDSLLAESKRRVLKEMSTKDPMKNGNYIKR